MQIKIVSRLRLAQIVQRKHRLNLRFNRYTVGKVVAKIQRGQGSRSSGNTVHINNFNLPLVPAGP